MPSETHTFFAVFDFGDDPSVVTEIMGIEPTKAWCKGDPVPNHPTGIRTHTRWALSSGLSTDEPLEAHLEALLTTLEARYEAVRRCAKEFHACIRAAIYFAEVNPEFFISPSLAVRLGKMGVPLEFDLYCLHRTDAGTPA